MFRGIIGYEFKKLFIRRNIIILTVIFVLAAFLCWNGVNDYNLIQTNKKSFQELERKKVSMHLHYTFYGVRGVRLLYIPDPLSVMFNDSAVFPGMTAHVDTGERLEISNSFKGKDLFSDSHGFMDFAGIMLLIASFLAVIYGWDATRNQKYLKLISDISGSRKSGFLITVARIILLNLVFWILCCLNFFWMLINGINAANIFYLVYVLLLTLVITTFVEAGAVIGTLKSKVAQFIIMPVGYFLLVLFIPWLILEGVYMDAKKGIQSIHKFEYETFQYLMKFEKKGYEKLNGVWKSGEKVAPEDLKAMIESSRESVYQKMKNCEDKRMNSILKRIRTYQTLSALIPTTLYLSCNKELSSKGFQNFVDFYHYAYDMKFKFVNFYLYRKFWLPLPKSGVEPFIEGNEDLFYGKSQLPNSFLLGLIMAIVYIAVLLVTLNRMQSKGKGIEEEKVKSVKVDFSKGNPLFALCKDDKIKSDIFRYYREQKTATCIDKIRADFPYQLNGLNGIKANEVLKFLCRLARANCEKVIEYLSILGIKDLSTLKLEEEEILKFYAAIKIAKSDVEFIVLNDFFKQKTREFEMDFFKLLSTLEASDQKILYLSCNMYYPKKSLDEDIQLETFYLFPLPIDEITLR
jgi:hypothetical protein